MSNPNNPLDLKKDSRRAAHTAAEKRRRDAINKGYEILNEAIIEVHNNYKRAKTEKLENEHGLKSEKEIKTEVEPIGKMSKSMTLHVTVEYLNYLTDEIRNQQKEIKRLENKKKILSSYEESKRKLTNFNAGQKKEQKNQELNRIKHDLFHGQLTHEQRLSLITMLSAMEEPPTSSADSVEEQQNQLDNKKASIFHSLSNTLFQKDYKPHVNHSNIDSLIHTVNCWSNLNLNSNLVHERFKQTQNETHNFDFSSADLGNLTHNLSTFSPKTHSISGSSMSSNKNTQSQISHGTGNSTSASVSGTLANVTLADSVGSLHSGTGLSSNNNANNVNNVNNVMNLQAIYANPSLNNSTTSLNTINTTNSENSPSQTFLNNASQVSSSSINFNQAINNSNLMSQGLKNHSLQNSGPIIGSNMNHASQIITTQMSSSGGSTFDVGQILAGNLAVSHASSSSSSGNINGASSKNLQDALFKRPKME